MVVDTTSAYGAGEGCAPPHDQSRDVGDIGHQHRAHLAGDLREAGEVDDPGHSRPAAEDQLGPLGTRQVAHLVEVDAPGVAPYAVTHAPEPRTGGGDAPAVGEVPAHRQRHPEDGVTGLQERHVDGEVGRGAGVGLDVGVVHPEQRLGPLDGECLHLVDDLLALVVALPGVALGVLVLQDGAGRLQHGGGHVVLTGDQAQGVRLEPLLGVHQGGEFGIGPCQGGARLSRTTGIGRLYGHGVPPGSVARGRHGPGLPRRTALRR